MKAVRGGWEARGLAWRSPNGQWKRMAGRSVSNPRQPVQRSGSCCRAQREDPERVRERHFMRISTAGLALMLMAIHAGAAQEPLALVRSIDLPRVEGRIDHLAFDAATQRLYIAALGNNTVEVLDSSAAVHLKSLLGFRQPQGIAVIPDYRSVAVANGQGDGLQRISADDYRPGPATRVGDDADNVRYDPSAKRVYVGFGSGAL